MVIVLYYRESRVHLVDGTFSASRRDEKLFKAGNSFLASRKLFHARRILFFYPTTGCLWTTLLEFFLSTLSRCSASSENFSFILKDWKSSRHPTIFHTRFERIEAYF